MSSMSCALTDPLPSVFDNVVGFDGGADHVCAYGGVHAGNVAALVDECSDVAAALGNPMSAGFVLLGAFVTLTGLVSVESIVAAMRELVPAYRTQHLEANERAIRTGADLLPALAAPAWDPDNVVAS